MGRIANGAEVSKPVIMMVVVHGAFAGVNILYKLGADIGMNLRVMLAYRFLFAAGFMVPIALVVERKRRPKLTWTVISQSFLCGLLGGSMAQNLFAQSLVLTSPTFASAMLNITPAITFVLAVAFGLEKLEWRKMAGKAKVIGTLLCIGGATLLTLYKGLELNLWSTNINILHREAGGVASQEGNPMLGALLIVACCFSSALCFIVQAKMIKEYPCPYSSTALIMSMGAIQAVVFALCLERSNWSQWKLGWDLRLVIVSYMGIVGSGVTFTLTSWCIQIRGPLFAVACNPLMLIFVAIAGSLVLNEKIHLGSVVGAGIIICGLYLVLWGTGKELKKPFTIVLKEDNNNLERIENDNNPDRSASSNANVIGIIPNGITMLQCGVPFDYEASEKNDEQMEEPNYQKGGDTEIFPNL